MELTGISQYSVLDFCNSALHKGEDLYFEDDKLYKGNRGTQKQFASSLEKFLRSKKPLYMNEQSIDLFRKHWKVYKKKHKIGKDGSLITTLETIKKVTGKYFQTAYIKEITTILDQAKPLDDLQIKKIRECIDCLYDFRDIYISSLTNHRITEVIQQIRRDVLHQVIFAYNAEGRLCLSWELHCEPGEYPPSVQALYYHFLAFFNNEKVILLEKFTKNNRLRRYVIREIETNKDPEMQEHLNRFKQIYIVMNLFDIYENNVKRNGKTLQKIQEKFDLMHDNNPLFLPVSIDFFSLTNQPIDPQDDPHNAKENRYLNYMKSLHEIYFGEKGKDRRRDETDLYDLLYKKYIESAGSPEEAKNTVAFEHLIKIPSSEELIAKTKYGMQESAILPSLRKKIEENREKEKITVTRTLDDLTSFTLHRRVKEKFDITDYTLDTLRHAPGYAFLSIAQLYGLEYVRVHEVSRIMQYSLKIWVSLEGGVAKRPASDYIATLTFNQFHDITDRLPELYHCHLTPAKDQRNRIEDFIRESRHRMEFPELNPQVEKKKEKKDQEVWPDGSFVECQDAVKEVIRLPRFDKERDPCRLFVYTLPKNIEEDF